MLLLAAGSGNAATGKDHIIAADKVWGQALYLHPWLAYRNVDWQRALANALPKIQFASTPQAYAAALDSMLGGLGDPGTHAYRLETGLPSSPGSEQPKFVQNADGTLVVSLHHYTDIRLYSDGSAGQFVKSAIVLTKAKAVVFDLRADGAVSDDAGFNLDGMLQDSGIQNLLIGAGTSLPSFRERTFDGFPDETQSDGIYSSGLNTVQLTALAASTTRQLDIPMVFVLNGNSPVPPLAIALRVAGRAVFVAQGVPTNGVAAPQVLLDAGDG